MDNYAAHKRVEVRDWLAATPRVHVHFTPTSASWLNLVEVWFGMIERQGPYDAACSAAYASLNTKIIRAFINGWNELCQPFAWTNPAEEILAEADRRATSATDH